MNDGKQVLRAVGQLAQQKAKLVLGLFRSVISTATEVVPTTSPSLVVQRLGEQIIGALAPEQFEIGFELLRFSTLHRACASRP